MTASWRDDAACAGSDVSFFPHKSDTLGLKRALALCEVCAVRRECLADDIRVMLSSDGYRFYGVRGGMSAKQRTEWVKGKRRLLKERVG